ncbi:MAG: spore protease YyaC, partial [Bacillota bacterium]
GSRPHVGTVTLSDRPLRPGVGVQKQLPEVGTLHVTGTVNVTGFMEYYVLQNTRLSLVMSMARWIAEGIQIGAGILGSATATGVATTSRKAD